jgi:hypothetical protein
MQCFVARNASSPFTRIEQAQYHCELIGLLQGVFVAEARAMMQLLPSAHVCEPHTVVPSRPARTQQNLGSLLASIQPQRERNGAGH